MIKALLQAHYKMAIWLNPSFNRKKFDMEVSAGRLKAINTSRNYIVAVLLTFMASLQTFSGILFFVFSDDSSIPPDFIFISFLMAVIGFVAFRQFLWFIRGRQELTIEGGKLVLEKKDTFFTAQRVYDLMLISNVKVAYDENSMTVMEKIHHNSKLVRKTIFSQTTGEVTFRYNDVTVNVFSDLTRDEKVRLVEAIKHFVDMARK